MTFELRLMIIVLAAFTCASVAIAWLVAACWRRRLNWDRPIEPPP